MSATETIESTPPPPGYARQASVQESEPSTPLSPLAPHASSAYAELLAEPSGAEASRPAASAARGTAGLARSVSSSDGRISYAQLDLDNMQQMLLNMRTSSNSPIQDVGSNATSPAPQETPKPSGYAMLDLEKTLALAQTRSASKESAVR